MILEKTYNKDWFEAKSKELVKGDAKLLEKAVMALTLLEQLVLNKVDFVFKGLCVAIHKKEEQLFQNAIN